MKLNLFYIDINNPIVFTGDGLQYENFGRIQSSGIEAELVAKYKKIGGFINLSYVQSGDKTSLMSRIADFKFITA